MAGLSASWTRLVSNSRLQRSSQVLSVLSSKAWIFGGELLPRQPVDNRLDVVDLAQGPAEAQLKTLQAPSNAPSPRVGSASATADGHIWLFSGRGGLAMDAIEEEGNLWRYSPSDAQWALIQIESSTYPASRSYHAMASDGERTIYIHAGCPTNGRLSDLWAFDTEALTWSELPSAPAPARGGTSIAFCDGRLYRLGGFDGTKEQGGQVDVYEPASKSWQSISFTPDGIHAPEPRSVAALLAVKLATGQSLLVTMFGERDPSSLGHAGAGKMLDDVWAFDIQTSEWAKLSFHGDAVPAPRGWFDADVLQQQDGDAIILHGGLAEDNTRLGDVWRLDFQ